MQEFLFSYGTLQKSETQLKLFGLALAGSKDTLTGFRLSPIVIEDKAFLSNGDSKDQLTAVRSDDENDVITGTVFELSPAELLAADVYEPAGYKRIEVDLSSGKQAWIYFAGHDVTADNK